MTDEDSQRSRSPEIPFHWGSVESLHQVNDGTETSKHNTGMRQSTGPSFNKRPKPPTLHHLSHPAVGAEKAGGGSTKPQGGDSCDTNVPMTEQDLDADRIRACAKYALHKFVGQIVGDLDPPRSLHVESSYPNRRS